MNRFIRLFSLLILLAPVAALTATPSAPETPGTLPGDVVVDSSGAASYSIPISLPSGTGGMEPDLALNYSSMGGNGLLGVGWSLSGLSAISRAPRTLQEDGYITGIDFDDANFALDGQRLVEVSSSPGEYRTLLESFSRVKRHGGTANNPGYWTVETKAGLKMTFGASSNSRVMRAGNTHVITWLLDKIEDTAGNFITFQYHSANHAGTRSHVIKKINYTGNASQGLLPYYSVQFLYETRTDTFSGFLLGTPFSTTRRLTDILVVDGTADVTNPAHASVIRRYVLRYGAYSAANGLSLLRDIQLTGSDGTESLALPATEFSYTEESSGFDTAAHSSGGNLGAWSFENSESSAGFSPVDLLGDGSFQLAKVYPKKLGTTNNWRIMLDRFESGPNGQIAPVGNSHDLTAGRGTLTDNLFPNIQWADFTGDGRTEVFLALQAKENGVTKRIYRLSRWNASTGLFSVIQQWEAPGLQDSGYKREQVLVADFTGNGLADVLRVSIKDNGEVILGLRSPNKYALGTSNHFLPERFLHGPFLTGMDDAHKCDVLLGDYNGDGLVDIAFVYRRSNGTTRARIYPTGFDQATGEVNLVWSVSLNGWQYVQRDLLSTWDDENETQFTDFNGNGLSDLVLRHRVNHQQVFRFFPSTGVAISSLSDEMTLQATSGFDAFGMIEHCEASTFAVNMDIAPRWFFADLQGNGQPALVYFHFQRVKTFVLTGDCVEYSGPNQIVSHYPQLNILHPNSNGWPSSIQLSRADIALPTSAAGWGDPNPRRKTIFPADMSQAGQLSLVAIYSPSGATNVNPHTHTRVIPSTQAHPPNLLTAATNGLGATTEIDYGYLLDPDLKLYDAAPAGGPSPAAYPVIEIAPPMWVVASVRKDVGLASAQPGGPAPPPSYTSLYTYGAARAHIAGHGFLGFGTFLSYDTETDMVQYQLLEQSWPLTGMVISTRTYHVLDPKPVLEESDFILLSQSDNENDFAKVVREDDWVPIDGVIFPMTLRATERSWEYRSDADAQGMATPWSSTSAPPYATVTSSTWFDGMDPAVTYSAPADPQIWIRWGDIIQVVVDHGGGFRTTTRNNFWPNPVTWHLGRLFGSQVKHEAPGTAPIVKSSSFEYEWASEENDWKASGLLRKERVEPETMPGDPAFWFDRGNTDPLRRLPRTTTYFRDGFGNVTSTSVKDVHFNITRTTTSGGHGGANKGRYPTHTSNQLGHRESYTYNHRLGKVSQLKGPNGGKTNSSFDPFGRTVNTLDAYGELLAPLVATTGPDGLGSTTTHAFHSSLLISPPSAVSGGIDVRSAYYVESRAVRLVGSTPTPFGPLARTYYDRLGREIRSTAQTYLGNGTTTWVATETYYNALGQVIAVTEPFQIASPTAARPGAGVYLTTTTYDALGRQELLTAPDDTVTRFGYDGLMSWVIADFGGENQQRTTWRNARGDMVQVRDANQRDLRNEYYADGNLHYTIADFGGANVFTTFGYDFHGNKRWMIDPTMGTWTYQHNAFGELIWQSDGVAHADYQERLANAADPENVDPPEKTTLHYDDLGRLIKRVRPDSTSTWVYWEPANPAQQTRPENGWTGALRQETHTQDDPLTAGQYTHRRSFYYDDLGRPMLTLHNTPAHDGAGGQWFYEYTRYDDLGRVARTDSFWRPKGLEDATQSPAYAWHTFGQIYTYDTVGGAPGWGFVTQVSDSQGHVWWSNPVYDFRGRVTQFTNGNGEVTNHTFHATRQTLATVRSRFGATDFHHMSFEFDALGNLTERKDHFQDQYETFRYDNLNRLRRTALNASAQGGTDDLTYDALGRIHFKNGVGTFTYTQANRPYQLTAIDNHITGSIYDNNGNLTRQQRFGYGFAVEWTSFNKPAKMAYGPVVDDEVLLREGSAFRYDAGGNRVAHIVYENFSDIRKTLYIGGFEQSRVKDENENWVTDYTRIAISAPTGVVGTYDHKAAGTSAADNTRSYYHYDHLGTIVAVTGSWMTNTYSAYFGTNPAIQRYAYDAWGHERDPGSWSGTPPTPDGHVDVHRGFTGHEMLRHLGLVHMNGRIYDPYSGRFLSPDPFVQSPGDLQNYNRYGYVLNNPLSYTDPSGYFFKKLFRSVARFVKQYWKPIVAIGLAALTGYGAMLWLKGIGWTSSLAIGAAAGAAAGFVGSFAGSLLHGGSMSQALGAGLVGALWGGLAGGAAGQIGSWAEGWKGAVEFKRALAHGISGGAIGQARDGNFFAGAFAGAASSWVSHGEFSSDWGDPQHIIAAAVVGGTAARIGGGSFENGAVTGAFQYLFNSRLSAAKRRSREAALAQRRENGNDSDWVGTLFSRFKIKGGADAAMLIGTSNSVSRDLSGGTASVDATLGAGVVMYAGLEGTIPIVQSNPDNLFSFNLGTKVAAGIAAGGSVSVEFWTQSFYFGSHEFRIPYPVPTSVDLFLGGGVGGAFQLKRPSPSTNLMKVRVDNAGNVESSGLFAPK